jgi:hypothetical protein
MKVSGQLHYPAALPPEKESLVPIGKEEARMGEMRNAYRISLGKPKGKRLFGRQLYMCKWEYNIKKDFGGIGWEGVDGITVVQDRDQWWVIVNTEMNLRIP